MWGSGGSCLAHVKIPIWDKKALKKVMGHCGAFFVLCQLTIPLLLLLIQFSTEREKYLPFANIFCQQDCVKV